MEDRAGALFKTWQEGLALPAVWGRNEERLQNELAALAPLWDALGPVDDHTSRIIDQIITRSTRDREIENTVLLLCGAIGSGRPIERKLGQQGTISIERWHRIWAYHASLSNLLVPDPGRSGYESLLDLCDPDGSVRRHISGIIGEMTDLKRLQIERFLLFLEFTLRNHYPSGSVQLKSHSAAVDAVEEEIECLDPENMLHHSLRLTHHQGSACHPGLELCHHKLFRRLDTILEGIESGDWEAVQPGSPAVACGDTESVESLLCSLGDWLNGTIADTDLQGPSEDIIDLLGQSDNRKVFLVSLLSSVLRARLASAVEKDRLLSGE